MFSMSLSIGLVYVCLTAVSVQAGSYSQDFNSAAEGSTDLGDGSTIVSSIPGVTQVYYHGSWKALRLAQDEAVATVANYAIPDLDPGVAITGFTATFDVLIKSDGGDAGGGFAFNFGKLGTMPYDGECGMYSGSGNMISVYWKTNYRPRSIDVYVKSGIVGQESAYPMIIGDSLDDPFQSVTIHLDANGLDVIYNGQTVFPDLDVFSFFGYTPSAGDRFAFSATTDDASEDVFIDNLSITTVPEPMTSSLFTAGCVAVFYQNRRRWR